jgi:hypothetical protein
MILFFLVLAGAGMVSCSRNETATKGEFNPDSEVEGTLPRFDAKYLFENL